MFRFITQLTSFLLAHSLLIGAGAFMLLRGALSRSLSAAIVVRVCPPPAELPAPKHAYRGWRERFARFVPDTIEDSVLRQAYRQRVAEQVRRKFLELVVECLFNLVIALGAYLTGWALTKTGLLTPDWLIFAVRLISLAIFVQTALRVWDSWDALTWRGIKAFYRDFGFNVVRFVEYQIASTVEAQATRAIEERVKRLGRVERAAYRWLGMGTDYYARVVSRRALDENRGAIRWILAIGAASAACYYAVLLFLIAPLVRDETGESFFTYVFLDPIAAALRFTGAHPLFLGLCALAGFLAWHWRGRLLRLIARPVIALLTFIENKL